MTHASLLSFLAAYMINCTIRCQNISVQRIKVLLCPSVFDTHWTPTDLPFYARGWNPGTNPEMIRVDIPTGSVTAWKHAPVYGLGLPGTWAPGHRSISSRQRGASRRSCRADESRVEFCSRAAGLRLAAASRFTPSGLENRSPAEQTNYNYNASHI